MKLDEALNTMLQDARDLVRGYYGADLNEADLDWDEPAQFHGDYWLETDARVSHAMGFISGVAAGLDMTPLELLDYVPERAGTWAPPQVIVSGSTPARNVARLTKRARKERRP